MSKYFKAIILENTALNKYFRLLTIDAGRSTLNAQRIPVPGQFYMLQAGDTYDPLLKRPFSIFSYETFMSQRDTKDNENVIPAKAGIQKAKLLDSRLHGNDGLEVFSGKNGALKFLYRIRGKGTLSLSRLKSGDIINVIGPLGNSYPEPYGDFIAVAGGIGIASLFPLLEKYKNRAYLFYGARNREELVILNEVKALSKEIFIATDDGSEGQKGLVTGLLKDSLLVTRYSLPIYACGSTPMLKELSKLVTRYSLPCKCYVSLEEHMACGVGACLGCVTKVRSQKSEVRSQNNWTYKRVCKEGPVFEIEDIVWE
jgi:dihydroorotate dehydrogenase electron transfer subunit